MIKEFSIENFKGIKSGKVEGLSEVNVFIGKNNSGKSTILEILNFVKAAFEPNDILDNPILYRLLQRRVDADELDQGQGKSLIAKLEEAIKKLNQGQWNVAINKLHDFIDQVNAYINAGKITF